MVFHMYANKLSDGQVFARSKGAEYNTIKPIVSFGEVYNQQASSEDSRTVWNAVFALCNTVGT
ncbi:hypothetical protein FS749_000207 [Ceratobasidium sp. UAMH 11750]|nr:hypothetical protein FS749_000207 [Ceratobasidium sp. UAMH 11750]